MRTINQAGIDLIKRNEGLRLKAYRDVAGVLTIGYGHVSRNIYPGQVISRAEADAFLADDIRKAAESVEATIGPTKTSNDEFAALVSLAFNIGGQAFAGSTVARRHNAGDRRGAAKAFELWCKITAPSGQKITCAPLLRRRKEEAALYLGLPRPRRSLAESVKDGWHWVTGLPPHRTPAPAEGPAAAYP